MSSAKSATDVSLKIYFIIISLLFVIKSYLNFKTPNIHKYMNLFLLMISGLFFIILYFGNMKTTESPEICGSTNSSLAFKSTIFPFFFIYSVGVLLLILFPGWLRGFSNTFGLSVAKIAGLGDLLKKLYPNQSNNDELVNDVYNNPSILVNELDFGDDEDFIIEKNKENNIITDIKWSMLTKLNKYIKVDDLEDKKKLIGFINLKNDVAYYIWIMFFSLITIITSTNYMLDQQCISNTTDNKEFQKLLNQKMNKNN